MIQLFNLSVINHINSLFEDGTEVYLACSNDSQNGIQFDHENGSIIWAMGVSEDLSHFVLIEVHCDTDFNVEIDLTTKHDSIKHMLEVILYTINQLKGK